MEYLPIFMDLRDREAIVVGGGLIASRKAALIVRAGARITVVSPSVCPAMHAMVDDGHCAWRQKRFAADDLANACIVVAATDDPIVNRAVYDAATALRIPVNVVDTPELCSFILPAIVDRSPVTVAVSTGGRSPVLARFVKSLLERALPTRLGRLAEICGELRARVVTGSNDFDGRRRFWDRLFESNFADHVFAGRDSRALALADDMLNGKGVREDGPCGEVYLIGAGPGDAELLTIRAQRLLQRADVVLFDRLVPVDVLDLCRREAEMVYVGKRRNDHSLPQQDISALLLRYAMQGKRVARLKGGDPFIFGRGGEELAALVSAGIDFQVVPGISAANGAASYAGIPLTHRDHAQGVSFWTGHTRDGRLDLDWASMARVQQTLVFYMGATNAVRIGRELVAHGMEPATPVAIVQAATTPRQRVHRATLCGLAGLATQLDPTLPSLIIVGSVVNLCPDLGWFEGSGDTLQAVFPPHLTRTDDRAGNTAA